MKLSKKRKTQLLLAPLTFLMVLGFVYVLISVPLMGVIIVAVAMAAVALFINLMDDSHFDKPE